MSKLKNVNRIHFVGAGGISMSALAKLMLLDGKSVSGSDIAYTKELEELQEWGVRICVGHSTELMSDAELVVYSLAVPQDDPELVFARENAIPVVARQHFLSEYAKEFGCVIAVSGTHGKTTATAMIAAVFDTAQKLFTAHVGGNMKAGGNAVLKGYDFFITEACEYQKSLLALYPDVGVVLNMEADHPDTYSNDEELRSTFDAFVLHVNPQGLVVLNADSAYNRAPEECVSATCTFGINRAATVSASHIQKYDNGTYGFLISHKGVPKITVDLRIVGYHNIYNALAAYAVCNRCGISDEDIKTALNGFVGVNRRFEEKGEYNGCRIYIDYAHHPTEIRASIASAAGLKHERIIVVFQPHTYSRTASLIDGFAAAFDDADKLYIFKEYAARESADKGKSAAELSLALKERGVNCRYCEDLLGLAKTVKSEVGDGDILLVLGAGDVYILADLIANNAQKGLF